MDAVTPEQQRILRALRKLQQEAEQRVRANARARSYTIAGLNNIEVGVIEKCMRVVRTGGEE